MTKFTQKDLARAAGMSAPLVSQILSGKMPVTIPTAKKIGAFTGHKWTDFIEMPPKHIEAFLVVSMYKRQVPECQV